jgi:hypothetical protein
MPRKRPCRICRRWFRPHPRAGDRQKVCSELGCQRERHRRSCASWHSQERESKQGHRIKQAIIKEPREGGDGEIRPLPERLAWDAVRDAVGLEIAVIAEEFAKQIEFRLRDGVLAQTPEITGESNKHPRGPP